MDFGVDWLELPTDLLGRIARCLATIEDVMAFRGVCTGWRSAVPKDKFLTVSKVPVLMLSEKIGKTQPREFYSLYKRKICMTKHFPEAKSKRCIDVGFGWVLVLSSKGCAFLLKPLSSAVRIELPSYREFPRYNDYFGPLKMFFIRNGMLTANPSETSNFKLVLSSANGMGIWKNGDENWSRIHAQPNVMVLRRDGKLYKLVGVLGVLAANDLIDLEIWDLHGSDFSKPEAIVRVCDGADFTDTWQLYLVESTDGELLLIKRNHAGPYSGYYEVGADYFGVMRVDLVKGGCTEMNGLGNDAIFLGNNDSVAVDATEFPGILKPNCIYFTDDRWEAYTNKTKCPKGGGKDMGIYNVADGSIERFGVESYSHVSPPLWVFPSL